MADIQAFVTPPDLDDDPQKHEFKWGKRRILHFIVKVDGARGGETVTVNIHNDTDLMAPDEQAVGTISKGDNGSFGVVLTFGPDRPGKAPLYHLGTGPDQTLIATVTTNSSSVTGPSPYTYTTVV